MNLMSPAQLKITNGQGLNCFRNDINALRAVAVIAVIAYHFGVSPVPGGFVGVDVFFVISGFLITSQIQQTFVEGRFSFKSFYLSRLRRIFPALVVVCCASLVWGWFQALPHEYRAFARNASAAIFFVSNIAYSSQQGYFDSSATAEPLLHTWSLSVEGQFYLFLPLYFWLVVHIAPRKIVLCLSAAAVASFAWSLTETNHIKSFYLIPARSWEFLLGGILSSIRAPLLSKAKADLVGILALFTLLSSFVLLNSTLIWPSLWTLVPITAVLALLAVPNATLLSGLWTLWPIQRLGDLSYSLYLWHWPVLVYARQYLASGGEQLTPLQLLSLLALTLTLSVLSWRFIEQPIRQRRDWWSGSRLLFGFGGFALVSVAFTFMVVATHGLPQRFPSYVQRAYPALSLDTPRPECFRDLNSKKKSAEEFCTFGSGTNLPTALLWGDSHANQYVSALTLVAQHEGLKGAIATQAECGPSSAGGQGHMDAAANELCERFNAEVRSFIRQTPSLEIVIIGRIWRNLISVTNTVAATKELIATGKKVILVGPLPSGGFIVPDHWSRLQLRAGHRIDDLVVSKDSQRGMEELWTQTKAGLVEEIKSNRLIFVDPFETYCDSSQCYLVKDGVLIIRDSTHLSTSGANMLLPEFARSLTVSLSPVREPDHER